MTVKEWLERGREAKRRIEELKRERERLFEYATDTVTHIVPDKVRSSSENMTERRMILFARCSHSLESERDRLMQIMTEIRSVIEQVEDITLRRLLSMRYIECMTWEGIAENLYYSDYWVRTALHDRALQEIQKIRGR